MKTNIAIAPVANPRIQQLQQKITSLQAFSEASIESPDIIKLLKQLIKTDNIPLTSTTFSNPNDNALQVTATATLFSLQIKINTVFTVDDSSKLSMTMNSYADLSMTLSAIYEAGLVPASKTPGLVPAVPIDGLSFVFDSAAGAFTLTGTGEKWSFLGYTDLYVDAPTLRVVNTVGKEGSAYQCIAGGSLVNSKGTVNVAIEIGLPIGVSGWYLSLPKPTPLSNGVAILDELTGISISGILPEQFISVLEKIELDAFYIGFDPQTKSLSVVQVMVSSKAPWEIVKDKLRIEEGITLTLTGQRYKATDPLAFSGSIKGTAAVNYANPDEKVQASATIPIPLTDDWDITLANDKEPLGIGKLIAIVPGVKGFLPKGLYEKLNEIVLEYLTIRFRFQNGFSFTKVAFAIHSANEWTLPMLQQAIYLDKNFRLALDIPLPYTAEGTSGELAGVLQLDDGNVSIPVRLAKTPEQTNWVLNVTSEEIPLPSISSLSGILGNNALTSASPPGLMQIGDFVISDLDLSWQFGEVSKLLWFAFTIASTPGSPAWNLVPGYFELTDLLVSLAINNTSVSEKDISGNIEATVTWILNKATEKKLVLGMSATKPSSNDPWKFAGTLEEELDLKELLLALHMPQSVVDILPGLKITQFDLSIEPSSGSFSVAMAIAPTNTWTILTIGGMNLQMDNIGFSVEKYDEYLDMAANGSFNFGTDSRKVIIALAAAYSQKNWSFSGSLDNTGADGITVNEILAKYIPGIEDKSIPQVKISQIDVAMVKGTTETNTPYNTLDFTLAGSLTLFDKLTFNASVDVQYDSRISASPYNGTKVQGTVLFGGLTFDAVATYNNGAFSQFSFLLTFKNIIAKADVTNNEKELRFEFGLQSTNPNQPLSLGDVISSLVEAATGEVAVIPSPWNFINNIPVNNINFVFQQDKVTNQKTIGLVWPANINLVFINIQELSLLYSPDPGTNNGPVMFKVTKGTFLGMPIDQLQPAQRPDWDLRDPAQAPAVPGFGNSTFKLQFLGIGNQVGIIQPKPPTSVSQAITNLADAFKEDGSSGKLPPSLYFDKNNSILFGAKFLIVEYIQFNIVFYDPVMYGISIGVTDGKFKNLYFEILYKKINDNVGVYQIDLVLPDFVRQQQFGAVSVTLPAITLSIYTNGDFIIDMGFPKNGDFSRSFGLELSIFTGSGGFYFGKLSNDTATMLPKADGQFNPVIIFGIGIRAGIGKSINKGILKAELSLTIQVILEGILAWYKANPTAVVKASQEELYYRIQAQAALVGRIYGEIDFAIISATLEVMVRIAAQLVLEAYRQSLVTFTAEVYAAVKVRINLGLFSISISCSFRTTISDSFTIGSNGTAPWDSGKMLDRSAYFTPLDMIRDIDIPKMDWVAPMTYPKEKLNLLFIPQLSVKYSDSEASGKVPVGISLLYIANQPKSASNTDFTVLSRAFLAWVFNAYFSAKPERELNILDQPVAIDDVNAIFAYFSQEQFSNGSADAINLEDMYEHFFPQAFKEVAITTQQANQSSTFSETDLEVGYFPMIPFLEMTVSGQPKVKFSEMGACDPAYLQYIKQYFTDMQVQAKARNAQALVREDDIVTMAEFLFSDYFTMMAKSALQDVINGFKQTTLHVATGDTLAMIAKRYRHYGVTAEELAFSNRHQPLYAGAKVRIPGFRHRLRDNEQLADLLKVLPGADNVSVTAQGMVDVPSFVYSIPETDTHTLWTVAGRYNIPFHTFLSHNIDQPGLFRTGTGLLHAFVATKTVKEILDELQVGPQFSLSNLGGTVSRFFLHGLRIPKAINDKSRIGLYEASWQQFNLTAPVLGQTVKLEPDKARLWLNLGITGSLLFEFNQAMSDAATALLKSQWVPGITLDAQPDVRRYRLHPKTFALPNSFTWQNPNAQQRANTSGDSYIWMFPAQLQQYLSVHPGIPYQMLIQSASTAFSLENETSLKPLFWSTSVTVSIRQVPVAAMPGSYLDNVYVVEGCGEADGQLLQQLLLATTPPIVNLDILFTDNTAKNNDGEPVNGLVSNALSKYKTFLLQTNFSTVSNPGLLATTQTAAAAGNLLGMDAPTFLRFLWECSIVRSGGYYLHYTNATGGGLPGYIFDEEGKGNITILVSYNIPADSASSGFILPKYVNSVVIDTKTDPAQDSVYAGIALTKAQADTFDPVLQTIQATILPGTGMFKGQRANPATLRANSLADSADQQLSELFQLMEYRIDATSGVFRQTDYALPAGPLDQKDDVKNAVGAVSIQPDNDTIWNYGGVLPIYPFAEPVSANGRQTDPYGANGKIATIRFNFLDVFGNTLIKDDTGKIQQQITPGYTDPVIGIDQWINIARNYSIAIDTTTKKPTLNIHLVLGADRYKDAKQPFALAQQDLKRYRQIAYQLAQPGIAVNVTTSLGTLEAPATTALAALQEYVTQIIGFLEMINGIPINDLQPVKTVLSYGIDPTKLNAAFIFHLTVAISIERTLYIDPQFTQEPGIRRADTTIAPDLYDGKESDTTALSIFAKALELALPVMKVAVGQSGSIAPGAAEDAAEEAAENSTGKEIWLLRFARGTMPGISYQVNPTPVYFAIAPLSTSLISRPSTDINRPVPIRTYTPGTFLGNATAENKSYAGIDIEVLARTFVDAADNFLSPAASATAWIVEQSGTATFLKTPFRVIEQSKRAIAAAVADNQLTNILKNGSTQQLAVAREATKQQLLTLLGNMYRTDAIVQTEVTVQQGFTSPPPNLYGNLVFASKDIPQNAYSFSPVKIPLPAGKDAGGQSNITTLFSVRPEGGTGANQSVDLIDAFQAGLNFQLTALEHNFGTPINGYTPSSWLTLAIPLLQTGADNTALIQADIPIPLKAYPTAPSLVVQTGTATPPPESENNAREALEAALQWDYTFSYNYVIARQDLIYLEIRLNVVDNNDDVDLSATPPDLFEALLQFSVAYEPIMSDITANNENSLIALQSYAWMVKQVADAWPAWFKKNQDDSNLLKPKTLKYIITEYEDKNTGNLLISVRPAEPVLVEKIIPLITIDGYTTKPYAYDGETQIYAFVQVTNDAETPLSYAGRKQYSERGVTIQRNNVLIDENAWAGVAIHRNEVLAGQPTNEAFRYITPYIRFAGPCYPNLNSQTAINIAEFTPDASSLQKVKLQTLLDNFFEVLFKAAPDREIMLQLQAGYSFTLQTSPDAPAMLGPTLPIVLATPASVNGKNIVTFTAPFANAITGWFKNNQVAGKETTGKVSMVLSLFAATNGDMHHPLLTLDGLYLPTSIVDFS